MATVTKAAKDVLAERRRQTEVEGWTPEHDDKHGDRSLALAAACYAMVASVSYAARKACDLPAGLPVGGKPVHGGFVWMDIWPWARECWKPQDRRSDLVRAGALLIAEIERIDRAKDRREEAKHIRVCELLQSRFGPNYLD
jgi:hypothetical protein